ncbi:methylmalonyl-CoA mutase family protein [Streptomyces sp. NPDC058665]|uniref:methylmalonyl-CoA mutase family protein n=1 Tax=Streptomyces sp. NPDC058665 TaxID=3346586 RepID=UPI0036669DFD
MHEASPVSAAFALTTQVGYDSTRSIARSTVGKTEVAMNSIDDIRTLFESLSLSSIDFEINHCERLAALRRTRESVPPDMPRKRPTTGAWSHALRNVLGMDSRPDVVSPHPGAALFTGSGCPAPAEHDMTPPADLRRLPPMPVPQPSARQVFVRNNPKGSVR